MDVHVSKNEFFQRDGHLICAFGGIHLQRLHIPHSSLVLNQGGAAIVNGNGSHFSLVSPNAPKIKFEPHPRGHEHSVRSFGNDRHIPQIDTDVGKAIPPGKGNSSHVQFSVQLVIDRLQGLGFPGIPFRPNHCGHGAAQHQWNGNEPKQCFDLKTMRKRAGH